MSSTSLTPNFNGQIKSFWDKREGKAGKLITYAVGAGALYGLWLALPFLVVMVWDAVSIAIGVGILASIAYVVTNKTITTLFRNVFQSFCRHLTQVFVETDPIGILKNNLDDMKTAKAELDKTVLKFAGSENRLLSKIADKTATINELGSRSNQAALMLTREKDPDKADLLKLSKETSEQKAGMLMEGIKQLKTLEAQTKDMLDKFRHWSRVSDAKIDRTEMKVDFYAEQRKDILDAQRTLGVGYRLLKGDPEQLKLVDSAIEFLADDAAQTIGEIQEFNRYSDKLLTEIDIDNSGAAESARQRFAEFGVKLDNSSSKPAAIDTLKLTDGQVITPTVTSRREVSVGSNGNDYNDMFKK